VFVAHSALETGRWRSIHWNNFGNIKRGKYDGYWTMFRCNEILHGKVQWFDPPDPQTWFRAYKLAAEGALEHFAFLHQQKRWQPAWEAAVAGDPDAFCRALKAAGYFTAELEPYRRAVVSLHSTYLPVVKRVPRPVQCEPLQPCFIDDDIVHSPSSDDDLRRLLELLPEPELDWELIMADKDRDVREDHFS